MKDCKFNKDKAVDRVLHEICANKDIKEINHSELDVPCIGKKCGKFEKITKDENGTEK